MKNEEIRVIKISKDALYEFIYEKFIESLKEYFNVESINVSNAFEIDFNKGNFIFLTYNFKDEKGNLIELPAEIDLKTLLDKLPDTTNTMFQSNRYKNYTKEELLNIIKK